MDDFLNVKCFQEKERKGQIKEEEELFAHTIIK